MATKNVRMTVHSSEWPNGAYPIAKWIAAAFELALSEGANWEDIRCECGGGDWRVVLWPVPVEEDKDNK